MIDQSQNQSGDQDNQSQNTNTKSGPQPKSGASLDNKDVSIKSKTVDEVSIQEEKEHQQKIAKATQKMVAQERDSRLKRVDKYLSEVEGGVVKKEAKKKKKDIEMEVDKEKKLRRLEEAIKSNLTGYDLEKEL